MKDLIKIEIKTNKENENEYYFEKEEIELIISLFNQSNNDLNYVDLKIKTDKELKIIKSDVIKPFNDKSLSDNEYQIISFSLPKQTTKVLNIKGIIDPLTSSLLHYQVTLNINKKAVNTIDKEIYLFNPLMIKTNITTKTIKCFDLSMQSVKIDLTNKGIYDLKNIYLYYSFNEIPYFINYHVPIEQIQENKISLIINSKETTSTTIDIPVIKNKNIILTLRLTHNNFLIWEKRIIIKENKLFLCK